MKTKKTNLREEVQSWFHFKQTMAPIMSKNGPF